MPQLLQAFCQSWSLYQEMRCWMWRDCFPARDKSWGKPSRWIWRWNTWTWLISEGDPGCGPGGGLAKIRCSSVAPFCEEQCVLCLPQPSQRGSWVCRNSTFLSSLGAFVLINCCKYKLLGAPKPWGRDASNGSRHKGNPDQELCN